MILETERLILSELSTKDAPFFYELVNDPEWIRYVGDKDVNSIEDAKKYLANKIIPGYTKNGFGFYLILRKADNASIGISGLVDREGLEHVDVGYALLAKYRKKGYAFEATKAVLDFAKNELQLDPVLAITNIDNIRSTKLLERLGLHFDKIIQLPGDKAKCKLFTT